MNFPKVDGEALEYNAVEPRNAVPRIYYVNGIQTDSQTHAMTAMSLSILTEHEIVGVYNESAGKGAGIIVDLLQCGADWADIFLSKLAEQGTVHINNAVNGVTDWVRGKLHLRDSDPVNVAESIRSKIPERYRLAFIEGCVSTYNRATASLFRQLRDHVGQRQLIVAHSQGNLIAADALWSMVIGFGESSLANMQVYSLASPAPAWPLGIRYRRKVYGHTNDLVTYSDPHNWTWITERLFDGKFGRTAGDWRQFGNGKVPHVSGPHDLPNNVALNFARTIRRDLGLPEWDGPMPSF